MNEKDLVYIDDFGLLGTNFYWAKYESKGLSKEDVVNAGLTSDRVQVHKNLIPLLVTIDETLQERGYRLYIKEGYRSKALYEIIYTKRVQKFGQEETDRLLNMRDMPHADGKTVDIALWDTQTNTEVYMRNGDDGVDALFVDFYKNKNDNPSKKFQELQEWVIAIMQQYGFRLGTKREYFHFDYRPAQPKNYP